MPKLKIDLVVDDKGSLVVRGFGREVDKVAWSSKAAFRGLASEIKVAGAALAAVTVAGGGYLASKIVDITDQYIGLESKLKLVTSSTGELRDVQEQLYQISQDSRQGYASTVELYSRMARATRDTSISQKDMLVTTEAINKAMLISGATAQESSAAMVQLSQGLASGALRGDELRSVLEQTPRVARMVADGLGIARGQLRAWGKEGKLTTETVINAIKSQVGTINSEFSKMNVTVGQSSVVLANSFKRLIADGGQAASMTETLSGAIKDLSDWLDDNREDLSSYFAAGVQGAEDFFGAIQRLGTEGKPYLDSTLTAIKGIYTASIKFADIGGPSGMEWGLVGYALLRGGPQAAALTAALVTVNNELAHFNLNLGSLKTSWQEYDQAMGNVMDVLQGKKDWNTGAAIIHEKTEQIKSEISDLQNTIDEAGDPVGEFFRKMFTGAAKSEEQIQGIDRLKEHIGRLQTELSIVAGAYEDVGGSIDNVDWEGPAPAFERTAKAAKKSAEDICKSNKKVLTCVQRRNKRINDSLDRMFDKEARDSNRAHQKLLKSYADAAKGITDNWQLEAQDREDVEIRAINAMVDMTSTGTAEMQNYWTDFSENTKDILHNFVEQSVKLEFDSIGDAFSSLLDSMLNMFVDWIAKMVANWAMSGLTNLVINGNMSGFSLGSLFGGSGGGGLGTAYTAGSAANTVSGWFGGPSTSSITASASSYASGQLGLGSGTLGSNLGTGASALYGAGTTGVGTIGSWYAGLQAAGNGVNAGTQLALIEGTYGQVATEAASAAATEAATSVAAGSYNAGEVAALDAYYGSSLSAGTSTAATGATAGEGASAGLGSLAAPLVPLAIGAMVMAIENAGDDLPGEQAFKHFRPNINRAFDSMSADDMTQPFTESIKHSFDFVADYVGQEFRDMTSALGASFDTAHVEQYIEAVGGVDISMDQASSRMQLAIEAANGSDEAFVNLQGSLTGLGIDSEKASELTFGLVEAVSEAGLATDATMLTLSGFTTKMMTASDITNMFGADLGSLITQFDGSASSVDVLIDRLTDHHGVTATDAEMLSLATSAAHGNVEAISSLSKIFAEATGTSGTAKNATEAFVQAIRHLSNTNLDLEATARLNVEVQGAAQAHSSVSSSANVSSATYVNPFTGHQIWAGDEGDANGGIFRQAAYWAPDRYAGEAGTEVVAPLPYGPNMMKDIYDATVKAKDKPTVIHLHVNSEDLGRFIDVRADGVIVKRGQAGTGQTEEYYQT